MAGTKSSRILRISEFLAALLLLAAVSFAALEWFHRHGYVLYYGDAQAHLNIARRIVDSRTPGVFQIGTVWLPLPHVAMLPFVRDYQLWRTGLAGSIPSAACFVIGGLFLFAAVRRLWNSTAAAFAALAVFAVNPNVLYLQSTAMTEPVFFAALFALFYFTLLFRQTQSVLAVAAAGVVQLAATLTRYEGWFLVPFVGFYFLFAARRRRLWVAMLFAAIAAVGPLYWLAHNWWFYGDALEFYRGAWSAKAIYERSLAGGMERYAGDGDWAKALLYFGAAARLCAGTSLVAIGLAGGVLSLARRSFWPLALLALAPIFYLWSIHSGSTPIFVPQLWPGSYYNTRYGLAALPLLALGASAWIVVAPSRLRPLVALAVFAAAMAPWLWSAAPHSWICWKESEVNSVARRAWTAQAAAFLASQYRGGGILTSFGDMTGVFLQAGIPLRETLHEGNHPHWQAAVARPDLFLWEKWAVAFSGDPVATAILRARRSGPRYECVKMIQVKGAPVIEIYRRIP